jgi:hypothetical protein
MHRQRVPLVGVHRQPAASGRHQSATHPVVVWMDVRYDDAQHVGRARTCG